MIKVLVGLFLVFLSSLVLADDRPCWHDPDLNPDTTQTAILKTYLLPIRLESPREDLELRIEHDDYRFIAIGGFGMEFPGLRNKELLCQHGFRYISGTSDALESREHGELIQAFSEYAEQYNSLLEERVSGE